jgi:hypothetical protein
MLSSTCPNCRLPLALSILHVHMHRGSALWRLCLSTAAVFPCTRVLSRPTLMLLRAAKRSCVADVPRRSPSFLEIKFGSEIEQLRRTWRPIRPGAPPGLAAVHAGLAGGEGEAAPGLLPGSAAGSRVLGVRRVGRPRRGRVGVPEVPEHGAAPDRVHALRALFTSLYVLRLTRCPCPAHRSNERSCNTPTQVFLLPPRWSFP